MANKSRQSAMQSIVGSNFDFESAKAKGISVKKAWEPTPAQLRVLHRTENEILFAGSRYGGKTELGRMWMISGNLDKPDFDANGNPLMVNRSYVNHPHFLGAVIRLNEKDLAEWVDRALPYYVGLLGGTYTKNPSEFRWDSGARVFLGHAQDASAWTKYQGLNIVRFLIEEAGQIPDFETFDLIRSSCRSLYPDMRAQILLTANPGGRGMRWLIDRYIEPQDKDGNPINHPTEIPPRPIVMEDGGLIPIREEVDNPFGGPKLVATRVWVPSKLTDNPHAMKDAAYIATLATIKDEKTRRAFLFGDWKAFDGGYFSEFRRETHTFDPKERPMAGWWKVTASLDWGFVHNSAAYWHKRDPETKQHLIFREFVTNRTDPVQLGEEIARQSMPDLQIQGSLVFHVSHDLFHQKIGEITWVELISKGAQKVLGQGKCYLPDIQLRALRQRYEADGKPWDEALEERILSKPIQGITFRRAPSARAVGFMYMRSLMRMVPSKESLQGQAIDWALALQILEDGNSQQYADYLRSFQREREALPELMISTDCPRLIEAIPKAVHSEENPEDIDSAHFKGMDELDSARYLLSGIRDEKPTPLPRGLEMQRRVEEAMKRNPKLTTQDKIWIARDFESEEVEGESDGFCLGRSSRATRRFGIQ